MAGTPGGKTARNSVARRVSAKAAAPAKAAAKAPAAPAKPRAAAKAAPVNGPVATKALPAAKPAKPDKARKPKLVRDSFTIPKTEYAVLGELKQRAAGLGRQPKKSEVLRAGIMALAAMTDAAFLASVDAVPAIKTGRPAKA